MALETVSDSAADALVACPNCKSQSRTDDDPVLRKVCGVCGFPRVFLTTADADLAAKTGRSLLADAKRATVVASSARFGSWAVFFCALLAGTFGGLLVAPAPGAGVTLLVAAVALVAAAVALRSRGKRSKEQAKVAISGALEAAAQTIVDRATVPVSTSALEERLGVTTETAEHLLTVATALGRARIAVDADGRVEAVPAEFASHPGATEFASRPGATTEFDESEALGASLDFEAREDVLQIGASPSGDEDLANPAPEKKATMP